MKILKITSLVLVGLFVFSGCSSKEQVNPLPSGQIDLMQEKTYKDMEKKIIEENKEKWIEIGFERAKKVLHRYKDKINSYEVGKYALRKGYVTYPQIMSVEENGVISVQNYGCEIKKELNIDEIMTLFANDSLQVSTISNFSDEYFSNNAVSSVNNSYFTNNTTIESPSSFNEAYEKRFLNSYKNKEQLDKYNVSYLRSGAELIATFKNSDDYSSFCNMSNICK